MGEDDRDDGRPGRTDIGLLTRTRPVTKKPSMYRVLLLNDDFTPMDFVIHVLERFFSKDRQEATEIMMHVHRKGVGVCGKGGQSVPAGVGQPTLLVDGLTVGGTAV